MKTFKVITSWTGYSEITVQAENKQEAENLVANDEYDTDNEVLTGNGLGYGYENETIIKVIDTEENEWMEFFILILGILLYVLDSTQEEDKDE